MADRIIAEFAVPIPRAVTEREVDEWLEAASQRVPPAEHDKHKLRAWLVRRNARRYNKLMELMRWAEREYEREFGLLPEDVRWLLP